jgi:arylsulfatase A-like enzyme
VREAIAAYQACVTFADAQVGAVLDALERSGRLEDTVVALVGDNGFHLGEHGGMLRKDTLFEGALHVPLLIAAPTLPRGVVVREPVELVDLYPTIAELAGIPAPPGLDGRSLAAAAGDPARSSGEAVSYRRVQPAERGLSLRTAAVRYTLWPDGSEELYDRRGDAPESDNLAGRVEWASERARLRARLEAIVAAASPGSR